MTTFSDALASIGPIGSRLLISREKPSFDHSSYLTRSVKEILGVTCRDFQLSLSASKRKAEDELLKPAEKQLKMQDRDALKSGISPMDSYIATKSEKSTFTTLSSPLVAPNRKRKAEDEIPIPSKKPITTCKEGKPRASLDSRDFKIAETPSLSKSPSTMSNGHKKAADAGFAFNESEMAESSKKPAAPSTTTLLHKNIFQAGSASKDIHRGAGLHKPVLPSTASHMHNDIAKPSSAPKGSIAIPNTEKSVQSPRTSITPKITPKASSSSKDAQLGPKSDQPISNLLTSSRPHQSIVGPREQAKALQDPNSPPPKKGSYRELMSRKKSDMIKLPPEPTGKQIKEAAKAAKMQKMAPRRKPYEPTADPEWKSLAVGERKKVMEMHKRLATERVKQKFPRRAYNGTGAAQVQASSESKASSLKTTAPPVSNMSSRSPSVSKDSSDGMEAGYMDVEDEESQAALTAKQEDEEQARLEARLKEAKERRKMRQAQMPPRQR